MKKAKFQSPLVLTTVAVILALFCALPFLLAQAGGGKEGGKPGAKGPAGAPGMPNMKPTPVLVANVGKSVPAICRSYPGTTEAIESVRVIARISGRLEKIAFQEGDIVNKGDLLFNIEETEYAANLRAAKAQVVSSESLIKQYEAKILEIQAKIRYAETNYKRCKQLFDRGRAGSEDDVDNALSTLDSEKAQLEAANASLTDAHGQLELAKSKVDLAEFDFSHTKISSPIKGRVGRLSFTQGNFITPNDGMLVTIAQLDPIYIRFSISETDFVSLFESADHLRETTELKVLLADNSVYQGKGKIKFIDNRITKLDTLQVWAEFENPENLLNPGGIAKVILTKPGTEELPSMPASGILHDKSGEFVYVVKEGGMLEKRSITLGAADGNTQCVAEGLEVGETVVIGGTNKILPGMPVNPIFDQKTLEQLEKEIPSDVPAQPGAAPGKMTAPTAPTAPTAEKAQKTDAPLSFSPEEGGATPDAVSAAPQESLQKTLSKAPLTLTPAAGNAQTPEKKGEDQ